MSGEKNKSEDNIQASMVRWYNNAYCLKHHMPRGLIFSVPNGGSRDVREAMKLKATGLLQGVSDLVCITGNGTLLWIEVKTDTGRQSSEQIDFQNRVTALGYEYYIVRTQEQFITLIEKIHDRELANVILLP